MVPPSKIVNCQDSHVHWKLTGERLAHACLRELKDPNNLDELRGLVGNTGSNRAQGDIDPGTRPWVIGYGWDQNLWGGEYPNRFQLDRAFGKGVAVCFFRADEHAAWLNTEALIRAGWLGVDGTSQPIQVKDPTGGRVLRDDQGVASGVLIDLAMETVTQLLPVSNEAQVVDFLRQATLMFNRAGFTHIRDLTCDETQWNAVTRLYDQGELTLAVEEYFHVMRLEEFDSVLRLAIKARQSQPHLVRVKGIKIFFDGALGSQGALVSEPYGSSCHHGHALFSHRELEQIMLRTWQAGMELAVHVIGDEATDQVVRAAVRCWDVLTDKGFDLGVWDESQSRTQANSNYLGARLHLEHLQMARPQTLDLLVGRNVVCHMQPSHWLSDQHWLASQLGSGYKFLFPWKKLQQNGIAFDFGSDSPIESPSVYLTSKALQQSALRGIPEIEGCSNSWPQYHSNLDVKWTPETYSLFTNSGPNVTFLGRKLGLF